MPSLEAVLARRLRAVAEEKGIPISHVADHAGIARSHVWAILKEERSATLGLIERLAEVLGVDAIDLLTEEPGRARRARKR